MEQLKGVDIVLNLDRRDIEAESVIHYLLEAVGIHVLAKESVSHLVGDFLEREVLYVVKKLFWQSLDFLWHEQALVAR